jgi:hypothetical protein
MRIIAGKFKGKKIFEPQDQNTKTFKRSRLKNLFFYVFKPFKINFNS